MYIQEIIIDGFKSYGQKTVVSGFDPQFNAITGLNGTGKSNILDAICFNLGITNLSQVRAGSLQDLIYKQGQAGVTKATVTIIFNNSDSATSPVGYESHKQITVSRQVMIGGKTKYTINGLTVQQNQVQNFFHSVQLNVNNPHFLIMQGRITKVLNMKPPEILSMIEEASGTRMYEMKKEASLKILAKKQTKIDEIDNCMKKEILPALENLQTDRINYQKYQVNNVELEKLDRFVVACQFKDAEYKIESFKSDRDNIAAELEKLEALQTQEQENVEEISKRISIMENNGKSSKDSELESLKKQEADLSKEYVKLTTLVKNLQESVTLEDQSLSGLTSQLSQLTQMEAQKNSELSLNAKKLIDHEQRSMTAESAAVKAREEYQNAFAGIVTTDNAGVLSIPEQIVTWEKKMREAESNIQQSQLRKQHSVNELAKLKQRLTTNETSYKSSQREVNAFENKVSAMKAKLQEVNIAAWQQKEKVLLARSQELKQTIVSLKDEVDKLNASVEARIAFAFKDPERGFDRSRVKGLVARLVRVNDSRTATALEIAAGAKLYQVVVDTELTGKLLLQKGELKKRVTILPLNKISSRCTDPTKVSSAKSLASSMNGSAHLALELIGYDQEVQRAMEYVFGNTIICDTDNIAKAIAFDKSIRNRTVTLDGDSYDPSGTLTGGAKNQLGLLLAKIADLSSRTISLEQKQEELLSIGLELKEIDQTLSLARQLSSELEVAQQSLKISIEKLNSSPYMTIQNEISCLENKLQELQQSFDEDNNTIIKAKEELVNLKSLQGSATNSRDLALKNMENNMKRLAKEALNVKNEFTVIQNKKDAIEAEISLMKSEKQSIQEQIEIAESNKTKISKELSSTSSMMNNLKEKYEKAKEMVSLKQNEIAQNSKEIKQLLVQREKCAKSAQNASLESRKLKHKLLQSDKDFKDAGKLLVNLEKQYPWITTEKQYFGVRGSDFDFEARDVDESVRRHKQLKSEQEKLGKKINKKVMGMIEKAEAEYEELRRKKEVILNDKSKIEAVIEELDVKKSQALQSTWIKVTRDFGSIFSTLLPGTQAKLEPPEGQNIDKGLEVKVAFNGVWKESLTELSGGQRSLLALSLILSLLLFKPAPMYILDEVDAALDLSHTQNIGLMLRTHFSKSQFIVVSLKEGMFNNANVLFRTKFVDGVSAVIRTTVGSKARMQTASEEDDEVVVKKGKLERSKLMGEENFA